MPLERNLKLVSIIDIPLGKIISFRGVAGYHICCKTEGPRFETGRKHASILGLFASKRRQWKDQVNSSGELWL